MAAGKMRKWAENHLWPNIQLMHQLLWNSKENGSESHTHTTAKLILVFGGRGGVGAVPDRYKVLQSPYRHKNIKTVSQAGT